MTKKIIRSYLFFKFLYGFPFAFHHAIYVLFLLDNGMDMYQVGLINFSFMVAVFLFEVPTGVVADFLGRKFSVVLGSFITGLATIVYFLSYSFWFFVLSEVLVAFGVSMISGALDAWVKDSLDMNGYKEKIGGVFSHGEVVIRAASLLGGSLGAFVAISSLRLPFLISGIGVIVAAGLSIFIIDESYFEKQKLGWKKSFRGMGVIIKKSVHYGYQNKNVWRLIIAGSLLILIIQPLNMNWSIVFEKKIGLWIISIAWIGIKLFEMLGNFVCGRLIDRGVSERILMIYGAIEVGVFVLVASIFASGWLILWAFWLHEIGRGVFNPAHMGYLHENIPSKERATIGSFNSMIVKAGAAIGWLGSGYISQWLDVSIVWLVAGVICLIFIPRILWRLK
ncbi:MFS transporter [Candidatus Falkowbacteria bacterium]|jgi:MFS family permease|nr:MFS transporter [Candidatus Falkowbacteria bacterium]MBT5503772.1 MFS transporter [Candidatus Falkowbacteria bacterium]MBT6573939.1 MFS transporter [Candidatus Falkowbacteria bacterium]MBT7348349.1 MFS transporter [Candidatus Falkowbacteria bacterium]MBT7500266.1 MFS transporter [Candidatus Falkowbacteria bacterium]